MTRDVLFSSPDLTCFVLDIPASLENGQGGGRIRAAPALELPYATPEPKGKKREAILAQIPQDELVYHAGVAAGVEEAAKVVARGLAARRWCLPRLLEPERHECVAPANHRRKSSSHIPMILASGNNEFLNVHGIQHQVNVNGQNNSRIVVADEISLLVPTDSSFIWAGVHDAYHIMKSYEEHADKPLKFDIMVMDPPWTNRSVRKSGYYSTKENQSSDPFLDALKIVQAFLTSDGCVAVWITNKATVRRQVTDELKRLDFVVSEEWIWTKITTKGEPVTPLEGLWRKPYEILLLFRRQVQVSFPLRRFIFAVPDVHSRKPNLKTLFDRRFLPQRVLELFARNLTKGWWSVGDEVIQYQDVRSWHIYDGSDFEQENPAKFI